jgi:hypothetical protein
MSSSPQTVRDAVMDEGFAARVAAAVRERLGPVAHLVSKAVLEAAVDRVVEAAAAQLDTPLADLLTAAWARYPEIQELCDALRHPSDEDTLAELVEHRFAWTHEPHVDVEVHPVPAVRIPISLELGLTVKGGVLVIRGGRFRELRAGTVAADATFKVAEQEIASPQKEIELPRVLRFGGDEGVPIRREAVPVGKIAGVTEDAGAPAAG